MWMELTPVANEAHFIRAQLQGRHIGSEFGTWGPCVGGVAPSVEVCDGLDNDCNGCVEK